MERRVAEWGEKGAFMREVSRQSAIGLAVVWLPLFLLGFVLFRNAGYWFMLATIPLQISPPFLIGWASRRAFAGLRGRLESSDDDLGVSVEIHRKEKRGWRRMGYDAGILAHVEGWLVFRGDRTDWSLRPSDAEFVDAGVLRWRAGDGAEMRATLGGQTGMRRTGGSWRCSIRACGRSPGARRS